MSLSDLTANQQPDELPPVGRGSRNPPWATAVRKIHADCTLARETR